MPVYLCASVLQQIALKILIIRFSSIGDIVLTTPVVRCLKQQCIGVEVHYLTKASYKEVLAANPYIDKLHLLDKNEKPLLQTLKGEGYDYIIDLHHNIRSLRFKLALGVRSRSFDKLNWAKWLLVKLKINLLPDHHIVDRYMATLLFLGIKNDGQGLDYFIPENSQLPENQLAPVYRAGYVAFVIGGQHETKMLPREKILAICQAIQTPVVLLGGPEDKLKGDWIAAQGNGKIFNASGSFKLNESVDLLRKAQLILTHDTGLMHIAAAFRQKIIVIWGNTVPAFGMYPYLPDNQDFLSFEQTLECRPCSKIGYSACPKGHFKCMQQQDTAAIAAAVRKRLPYTADKKS